MRKFSTAKATHLHIEMYDDTWFLYFINLLACEHLISTERPKTSSRYRFSKVAVSSHLKLDSYCINIDFPIDLDLVDSVVVP